MTGALETVAATVKSERPLNIGTTLAPLRRGRGDPCHRQTPDGAIWRTSFMPSGPVTWRLTQPDRFTADGQAWGPGASEWAQHLPALVGDHDDASGFAPTHPVLVEAHRRFPNLRIGRTDRVYEALVPAVLEQRVHGVAAFASWRRLVLRYGTSAPGPAPAGMRVPPPADVWRTIPSWEYHRAGVDPNRSRTIVRSAQVADRLEKVVNLDPAAAIRRLTSIPGVGVWTAAEVAQRALGDADALSVGDYHLAGMVGWTLLGRPIDDEEMVAYLEPLRPHRYRAVQLLMVSGAATKPRFGPRTAIADHRNH